MILSRKIFTKGFAASEGDSQRARNRGNGFTRLVSLADR
jgi:hypothetical protein